MNQVFTHQADANPAVSAGSSGRNRLLRGLAPPTRLAWLAGLLCLMFGSVMPTLAATGIFQTYAIVSVNGAANNYRAGGANADAAATFAGSSYGSFTSASTLVLNGGEVKTFKNSGGDVTGTTIFYRVYKIGSTAPAFQSVNLGFDANLGGGGDQRWATTNANVNLLSNAISTGVTGRYNLEVYWRASTNEGDRFDSNSGNNFIATFDYTGTTLCGAYTINPAGSGASNFTSFTAAFTAVNALTQPVGCALTFNVAAGSTYTENPPILTATGTSGNAITFQKSGAGANPKINAVTNSGTTTSDGIIKLSGSDYVTFDGIDVSDANSSAGTTAQQQEYGYVLYRASDINGAQNNEIKNCVVTLASRTNANGIGIWGAQSTSAAPGTGVTTTSTAGANSNNKINGNTVSSAYVGIFFQASSTTGAANRDSGNEIGSTAGNTINNTGSGSASVYGIRGEYQINLKIENNNISIPTGAIGAVRGIGVGASAPTAVTGTLVINANTVTIASATTSTVWGIYQEASTALTSLTFTNNIVQNSTLTGTSGAVNWIQVVTTGIAVSMTGNQVLNNTTATTGAVSAIYRTGTSSSATTISSNTVSNNTMSGAAVTFHGIRTADQGSSTVVTTSSNTLSGNQMTGASATVYLMNLGTGALTASTNTITNNTIPSTTGTSSSILYGIYSLSSPTQENFTGNTITGLSIGGTGTSTGHNLAGINTNSITGTTKDLSQNTIGNLTIVGSGSGTVRGIATTTGSTVLINRNKIYDLSAVNSSAAITGIAISSGTAVTATNNIIGNLTAPAATGLLAISGIAVSGGTTTNLYHNTVYLNASSAGATFGTTGIFLNSTSANLDSRANLVVNTSTAAGTGGYTAAFRRSSGTTGTSPANVLSTSDYNLYNVGTASATNLIYVEGSATATNPIQTITAYKTLMGGTKEQNAKVEAVAPASLFASTTGSASTFLHINSATASKVESGGPNPAAVAVDFDNQTRGTYPLGSQSNGGGGSSDVGADEGDFSPVVSTDLGISALTAPTSSQVCFTNAETVSVSLKNFASTTINFATNPVTVSGNVVGPSGTTPLTSVVINSGTLAANGTQTVTFATTLNMTTVGTYTFNITATVTGDADNTNDALPSTPAGTNTRTVQTLAVGTASVSTTSACGASVALTLTSAGSTGGTVTWYSDADGYTTPIGTGTPFNTSITTTTSFRSKTVCGASSTAFSNTVTTTISNPTISTAPTPLTRCGAGSVTLTATSSAGSTPFYYAAASGGTALGSGASQAVTVTATPATQTFYVAARDNSTSTFVAGLPSNSATFGTAAGTTITDYPLGFNVSQAGTLVSVDVYPTVAGTTTIQLYSVAGGNPGAGVAVSGAVVSRTFTAGELNTKVTVPLGFSLSAGSYKLSNPTNGASLVRFGTYTGTYPLTSGPISVVGSYSFFTSTSYLAGAYNNFFNLTFSGSCESARTPIAVNVTTPAVLTPASSSATICSGGATTITFSGYSNLSVSPTTGTVITGNDIGFNPTTSTVYTVTGNDGTGPLGCSSTATVNITVNPLPNGPFIAGTPEYCAGGSTTLTVTSSSTIITGQVALTENFDSNPSTWTVAETSTRSGTAPGATLRFQRPPSPYTYSGTGGPTGYSLNGSRFIIATADTGGSGSVIRTRLISPSFSLAGYVTASLSFQQYFRYNAAGDSANVDVSTDGGTTWTLNVLQQNSVNVGSVTTPANGLVNLNAYAGQTNVRIRFRFKSAWGYFWTLDNVLVSGNKSEAPVLTISPTTDVVQTGNQFAFNPAATTAYTIRATYPTSTCFSEAPVTITVNPTPTITVTQTDLLCNGSNTGEIAITPVVGEGPFQYTLDNGGTFNGAPGARTFTGLAAGTYQVFMRDANLCVSAMQVITITEPAALTINTTDTGVPCHNGTTDITVVAGGGVAPYEYSINNGGTWFTNGGLFTGVPAANYFPRVRDANGCTTPGGVSYLINNPAAVTGTRTFTAITCNNAADGTITVSGSGGTGTLTYTIDNGSPQSNTTGVFSGLAPGPYTITIADANSCSTTLASVALPNPAPVIASISASGPTTFCEGGGVNLISSTGDSYLWSNGATTQQINVTTSGTYSVTVTTGTCSVVSNSIDVTVNPRPTATVAASPAVVCVGGNSTVTFTFPTGIAPFSFTYTINGGTPIADTAPTSTYDVNLTGITASTTVTMQSLTDGNCASVTVLPSITVNTATTTTWLGTNSNWYDAANWSVCVPSATISAVIPTNPTNQPTITSGNAAVNNLDVQGTAVLTVSGTGNLDVHGTFTTANAGSFVALAGTTAFVGTSAQPIPAASYFDVSVTGSTAKEMTGNVIISGDLDLSGGLIKQNGFDVTMNDTPTSLATISGADKDHFLIQNAAGSEVFFTRAGNATNAHSTVLFPIGTAANRYSPATLVFTTGSTYVDGVHASVTNTIPVGSANDASGANVVKKTWDVGTTSGTLPGGESATLTLEWNSADNGTTFDVSNNAVSHFIGGTWETGPLSAATNLGNGQLAQTSGALTAFSPFAIEDGDIPLPVELAAFTAVRKDRDALIRWTTANEKDNLGFAVQVSTTGGTEFRTLTFVNSQNANSSSPLRYEFTDREAGKSGVRYYRLVQTDLDGTLHPSDVRTVTFEGKVTTAVTVAPNPFTASIEVNVDAAATGNAQLTLIDALGRTVMVQQLPVVAGNNRLAPVLPQSLAVGTYTLITSVDGQQVRTRLVKQ